MSASGKSDERLERLVFFSRSFASKSNLSTVEMCEGRNGKRRKLRVKQDIR
jgi:hypothetical protein